MINILIYGKITALAAWDLLKDAAPWMLGGFFLAGIIRGFVPTARIARLFGRSSWVSVVKAAAVGIPLPLCSCGVIPVAAALRKAGASKGAVASFVIATPETGVDSIFATYALLDLPMLIARPAAAFATAAVAGIAENTLAGKDAPELKPPLESCACGCGTERAASGKAANGCGDDAPGGSLWPRLGWGLRYAFGEMFEDMALYLLGGFLVAGVLAAFVPPSLIAERLSSPFYQIIALVLMGTPVYVCATAATPIAAVLIAKGLSPGAALAFLLAGPATNASSLAVLSKYLGGRALVIYLISIVVMSMVAGLILNAGYDALGLAPRVKAFAAAATGSPLQTYGESAAATVFLLLCLNGLRLKWRGRRPTTGAGAAPAT